MKRRAADFHARMLSIIAGSVTPDDLAPFQREADAQGVPLDSYLEAWAGNVTRQLRGIKRH